MIRINSNFNSGIFEKCFEFRIKTEKCISENFELINLNKINIIIKQIELNHFTV